MSPVPDPLPSSQTVQNQPNGTGLGGRTPTEDKRLHRRLSTRQLEAISQQLTDRDRQALLLVSRFGVMSGRQLQALLWSEVSPSARGRVARRGLSRLVRLDVLQPLARRVGGERSGSASTTFAVGRAGQYLSGSRRRVRAAHTPGARYLAHRLAVAELYVELVEAGRHEGSVELLSFDPEPECWRPYTTGFAARQVLKPDAYLLLATATREFAWFVEQDMATEALPTIKAKALRYHDYYRTGSEQAERGMFPRTLWVVPDTRRAEQVAETLGRLPTQAQHLHVVTTTTEAAALLTNRGSS